MNAYFTGAARLGAALARDGALPAPLARGDGPGRVPRRSLAVVVVLSALSLTATTAAGVGPRPLVLLTTGSFVTVYALGTAAALRLLPRGTTAHRCALVSLVAVALLLALTRRYLIWPLAVTVGALGYLRHRRRLSARAARRCPVLSAPDAAGTTPPASAGTSRPLGDG
ncbi:hypothetical protein IAG44_40190 [Streptomyces roseirectus]|uniref:Amino acid permease n=1 Tax=Streptomyces roseirectus TaxID=2768066 RepID=A0A7H0IQG1_9ACTN|nr:hypothetical protein [Streptomyces roseirectus]QNP75027.1 hypothetical protein IAG44_40190 [Streptomyces roseirectus]